MENYCGRQKKLHDLHAHRKSNQHMYKYLQSPGRSATPGNFWRKNKCLLFTNWFKNKLTH